jgi:4-hydroxy-2-oxoglutarate aldolase
METLAGIYPPVPTPFDDEGEINTSALANNLKRYVNETELRGFVILGSNGEYVYLDDNEKLRMFEVSRKAIPSDRLFIAGTGAESTRNTIQLTKRAAEIGADAAIVVTPYYYKPSMTGEALIKHYYEVAEASPIPVIAYNVPAYTSVDMTSETLVNIGKHPNIIGVKESGGSLIKIGEICHLVQEQGIRFEVLAGSASFLLPALAVGAVGGVLATANIAPDACVAIWKHFNEGDLASARKIQHRLMMANAAVTSRFGVAGLKYAMDKLGYFGGKVRPPLLPLADGAKKVIDELLEML